MTSQIIYKGELRTTATHLQSGTLIETDAPTDNQGKGERFSPTDLVAVALGTCMITTIAIKTRDLNLPLEGTQLELTKVMASNPRRIGKLIVKISFPKELNADEKTRALLSDIALTCPVQQSLNPNLELDVKLAFHTGENKITELSHLHTSEHIRVEEA